MDTGKDKTGTKVIIAGAGLTGAECAIALAQEGKDVTVIDMISPMDFTKDASAICRLSINRLFAELNIKAIFESTITEIKDKRSEIY